MIPTSSQLRIVAASLLGFCVLWALLLAAAGVYVVTRADGAGGTFAGTDCALVFGAGILGTDTPSPAIERRVRRAAELYADDSVRRLILSGGKGDQHRASEASVMRVVAMRLGVDAEAIVLEEQSTSTLENLSFSDPLLRDCASVVGVSDRYHLARIGLLACLLGMEDFKTIGAGERPAFWLEVKSVMREAVGILYYLSSAVAQ